MTDATHFADAPRRKTALKAEYRAYFAVIFLVTLMTASVVWLLTALRTRSLPTRGPITRSLTQARIITPQIFGA